MITSANMARTLATAVFGLLTTTFATAMSLDEVTDPVGFVSASISPDGKHIAAIGFTGIAHGLILIDSESLEAKLIIQSKRVTEGFWNFDKAPKRALWVTNDLIAVDYEIEAESIDLNGNKVADLGESVLGKLHSVNNAALTLVVTSDTRTHALATVNAKTGAMTKLQLPPGKKTLAYAFDTKNNLRAVTMMDSAFWKDATTISNWFKPNPGADWVKLSESKITEPYWTPLHVPDEPERLIISSSIGRDTQAVFKYDTRSRQSVELMLGHETADILRVAGTDGDLLRVESSGMMPTQYWFDLAWSAAQKSVDQALPKHVNRLSGDPGKKLLVYSYSDVDPGRWLVVDLAAGKMRQVAVARPRIAPDAMEPMQIIYYTSGDGLKIPAYLTIPRGAKGPVPLIVMIHGGPAVRDYWGWNAEVQYFATHGYGVFQPQFRGSSGFGQKFMHAGYLQWGRAMQDDITAGVETLIKQGIVDRDRICIYGASYGGYAALWGLVKTPDLYRCGISFAGVSDIGGMLSDWSDSNADSAAREIMRTSVGDATLHKSQFDQVSPLLHAAEIRTPVLLMHGDEDLRVPISHSKKMMRALDEHHKPYEWTEFEGEGHGLYYVTHQRFFYDKVLGFIEKHLGKGIQTGIKTAAIAAPPAAKTTPGGLSVEAPVEGDGKSGNIGLPH